MVDRKGKTRRLARGLAGVALVLTVSACTAASPAATSSSGASASSGPSSPTGSPSNSPLASPTPTQEPAAILPVTCGAATDVASEPNWRQYADYRPWTTADGCLVRIDVLADRPGPAHCGFQAARVIITGIPIGARYTDESSSATYVRDPGNVFGDPATASGFDPHAKLPEGAVDTGFRQQGTQLWVGPTDRSAIYLVAGASVERWPLDPDPAGCM